MAIVDHSTIMDAASMIAAQLEDLADEVARLRHVMEDIKGYFEATDSRIAELVLALDVIASRTPEP